MINFELYKYMKKEIPPASEVITPVLPALFFEVINRMGGVNN